MSADLLLTRNSAIALEARTRETGDLLVWTVTTGTRPHSSRAGAPYNAVLLADTLEGVRALLPPGLAPLGRKEADDPVIVESWV